MEEARRPSSTAGVGWSRAGSSGIAPLSDEPDYGGTQRTARADAFEGYGRPYAPAPGRLDGGSGIADQRRDEGAAREGSHGPGRGSDAADGGAEGLEGAAFRSRRLRDAQGAQEGSESGAARGAAADASEPGVGDAARRSGAGAETNDEYRARIAEETGEFQRLAQQEGTRSGSAILSNVTPKNVAKSAVGALSVVGEASVRQAPGRDLGDDSPAEAYGAEETARRIVRDRLAKGAAAKAASASQTGAGEAAATRLSQAQGAKKAKEASSGLARLRAKVRAMRMASRAAQGAAAAEKAGVAARILQAASPGKALLWPAAAVCTLALLGIAAVLGLSTCAGFLGGSVSSLDEEVGTLEGNESDVAQFFFDKGYDDVHVAAILGNLRAEAGGEPGSDFNTGAVEEGAGAGHGIAQWTGSRWNGYDSDSGIKVTSNNLLDFATAQGKPWTDLSVQLDFLWNEMQSEWGSTYTVKRDSWDPPYPATVSGSRYRFNMADDLTVAVEQFCYGFERPGIPRISVRISFAEQYLEMLRSSSYVQAAIAIAEDDSHGYSMDLHRRALSPDVDCSSLVYYALLHSGYTTDQLGAGPFNTATMMTTLPACGFERLDYEGVGSLQPGDILMRDPYGSTAHTEIYVGDNQLVGAHDDFDQVPGDSSGAEVNVSAFYEGNWEFVFRRAA